MPFVESVSLSAAFLAGLLSFFSPCVLPLLPAYFSYISGLSIQELRGEPDEKARRQVRLATIGFVTGFSLVFIALGASASFIGNLVAIEGRWLRMGGGLLVVVLGLHMIGLFRLRFLEVDTRLDVKQRPLSLLTAVFIGMAFAAGWSPCIGPLLGAILVVAGTQETLSRGILLLALYSAGLAIPFLLLSLAVEWLFGFMGKARKVLRHANRVAGILLVATGILLATDNLGILYIMP